MINRVIIITTALIISLPLMKPATAEDKVGYPVSPASFPRYKLKASVLVLSESDREFSGVKGWEASMILFMKSQKKQGQLRFGTEKVTVKAFGFRKEKLIEAKLLTEPMKKYFQNFEISLTISDQEKKPISSNAKHIDDLYHHAVRKLLTPILPKKTLQIGESWKLDTPKQSKSRISTNTTIGVYLGAFPAKNESLTNQKGISDKELIHRFLITAMTSEHSTQQLVFYEHKRQWIVGGLLKTWVKGDTGDFKVDAYMTYSLEMLKEDKELSETEKR